MPHKKQKFFNKVLQFNILAICFAFFLLSVSGCMVGPDYTRPDTIADDISKFENLPEQWYDPNLPLSSGKWWADLGDPCIPVLVDAALQNNRSLIAATANLERSQALLERAKGLRLPDISYSAGRTRALSSFAGLGSRRINSTTTTYSQDLNISYVFDVFGKLKRGEAAAFNDLFATGYSRLALAHTLIAQVVKTRITISTQHRLLRIANYNIENWQRSLEIIERRYENGLVSPVDVYLARENLASSKATLLEIEKSLSDARHALDVLLGRRPGAAAMPGLTLPAMPAPEAVPAGLAASLLDRRPDLLAAEHQLIAATERVGVSVASLYPDLTLTASGGTRSDDIEHVFDVENKVWSLITGISAPLWRGGTLRADVRASKAAVRAAAAQYSQQILTAFAEVEDALVAEQLLRQRIGHLVDRLDQAQQAEKLARERYSRGVGSVIEVLETERRRRLAENELAVARGGLWSTRVDLHLALGGDWGLVGHGQTRNENTVEIEYWQEN